MKRNTKGQISISFNWIFVMIVGVIFLLFFFSIISNQSKTSTEKVSATIAKQFETILGTTTQKAGTFKTYRTSPIELNFFCDSLEGISYYAVKDTIAGYTTHDVLFSPKKIQGTSMFTWTQEWDYPYSVMNFLYVTNKFQMFIFYNQSDFDEMWLDTILPSFPDNLTKYIMNDDSVPLASLNNDLYTYVFFEGQLEDIASLGVDSIIEKNSNIVIISPDVPSDVFKSGTLYFATGEDYHNLFPIKRYLDDLNQSAYYGKASLYGAFFSGQKDIYDCNMNKAFIRLESMNKLNLYRVQNSLKDITAASFCYNLYNGTSTTKGLLGLLKDFSDEFEKGFTQVDKDDFIDLVDDLEQINSRVSYEGNCPGLY